MQNLGAKFGFMFYGCTRTISGGELTTFKALI